MWCVQGIDFVDFRYANSGVTLKRHKELTSLRLDIEGTSKLREKTRNGRIFNITHFLWQRQNHRLTGDEIKIGGGYTNYYFKTVLRFTQICGRGEGNERSAGGSSFKTISREMALAVNIDFITVHQS